MKKKIARNERYEQFLKKVTLTFSNIKTITAEKIGSGSFNGVGNDLFDGVFISNNNRFGVASLHTEHIDGIIGNDYLVQVSEEMLKGHLKKAYIIFDADAETITKLREKIKNTLNALKCGNKIEIVGIPLEEAEDGIKKLIENV